MELTTWRSCNTSRGELRQSSRLTMFLCDEKLHKSSQISSLRRKYFVANKAKICREWPRRKFSTIIYFRRIFDPNFEIYKKWICFNICEENIKNIATLKNLRRNYGENVANMMWILRRKIVKHRKFENCNENRNKNVTNFI